MPTPPFNTGKVKIGIHYVPPQQNFNTEATDYWQDVYIGKRQSVGREFFRWLLLVVFFAGVIYGFWGLQHV